MADKAIVVGSGAGGSTAAMVLAEANWDVVILEKGPNYLGDLTSPTPATRFSNDELKSQHRGFENPDEEAEPRTFRRTDAEDATHVGHVNHLPSAVGGGTVHWDAKTPRFWDIDFKKLTMLGPVGGADVQDWPFAYEDIAPYYDEIERLIGVAGDVDALNPITLAHAPRGPYPMPPGPPQYSSTLLAAGAERVGMHPHPFMMAINSQTYDGRPACNNCGFCSGYGCPIHARVGALAPLRRAVMTGRVEVRAETFVRAVVHDGRRASGVRLVGPDRVEPVETADLVVLAGSAIETNRLALLSELPDPNELIGRFLFFHWFTTGFAIFLRERVHAYRGRSTSHAVDDMADPDFPGAREFAQLNDLPYFRGGVLEMGGSQEPIGEAKTYAGLLPLLTPLKPFGQHFKALMRASVLRDRLAGVQMIGEDLAQSTNRVDLDPTVVDIRGVPVARITYSPHEHEITAQMFYLPIITDILKASGADAAAAVPQTSSDQFPIAAEDVPSGAHTMGGMRLGTDPAISVCDPTGRVWGLDNVFVADGSVFPTSGAHNPTLTIMATALRNARSWVSSQPQPQPSPSATPTAPPTPPPAGPLPTTGAGAALGAAVAVGAAALARQGLKRDTP